MLDPILATFCAFSPCWLELLLRQTEVCRDRSVGYGILKGLIDPWMVPSLPIGAASLVHSRCYPIRKFSSFSHILGSASREMTFRAFQHQDRPHDPHRTELLRSWLAGNFPCGDRPLPGGSPWKCLCFLAVLATGPHTRLSSLSFNRLVHLPVVRSTKWRLHTKNIYQIHTTSHRSSVHKAKGVSCGLLIYGAHSAVDDGRDSVVRNFPKWDWFFLLQGPVC